MSTEQDEVVDLEKEAEELRRRLQRLKPEERRKTIGLVSDLWKEEDPNEKGKMGYQPDQVSDQNTSVIEDGILKDYLDAVENLKSDKKTPQIVVDSSYKRLKVFSAKPKPGQGELDYRHWRRAALRVTEDEEMSEAKRKKIVLDSLQGKADDLVDFSRDLPLKELLQLLDSNFKILVEGDDLLADFYQMVQDEKKSASEYLTDLYIELTEVVKEGGATLISMPRMLLSQFIRGTRDEELLTRLRLEEQKSNPPSFPEFIANVRREESKRTERKLRLKRMSVVKASAVKASEDTNSEELQLLQKRVNKLESMCAAVVEEEKEDTEEEPEVAKLQRRIAQMEKKFDKVRPRLIFCYRCGEEGHIATECQGTANKELVKQKIEQRKARKRFQVKQNQGNE